MRNYRRSISRAVFSFQALLYFSYFYIQIKAWQVSFKHATIICQCHTVLECTNEEGFWNRPCLKLLSQRNYYNLWEKKRKSIKIFGNFSHISASWFSQHFKKNCTIQSRNWSFLHCSKTYKYWPNRPDFSSGFQNSEHLSLSI